MTCKASDLSALYGGTFDPVHYGHLRPVEALAHQVNLRQVTFLPNNVPPHRPQPEATPAQRIAMLKLAINGNPLFNLDLREMARSTPSWTIDTLLDWRQQHGDQQPLAFIIGQDSLLSIHQWHRWQELMDCCHLLVCNRPGQAAAPENPALQCWLADHRTDDASHLHHQPAGFIFLADTPLLAISATEIRRRRHLNLSCEDLLPPAVEAYIRREQIYVAANK